jgi:hypothetical protein
MSGGRGRVDLAHRLSRSRLVQLFGFVTCRERLYGEAAGWLKALAGACIGTLARGWRLNAGAVSQSDVPSQ